MKYRRYLIYLILLLIAISYIVFNKINNKNEDKNKTEPANISIADTSDKQKPTEQIQGNNSGNKDTTTSSDVSKPVKTDVTLIDTILNTIGNTSGNIANGGFAAQQGKWMYYSNLNRNKFGPMYRSMPDGETGLKKLKQPTGITSINVIGEWVYYYNSTEGSIKKIKTDGTGEVAIINEMAIGIVVVKDWIYYSVPKLGIFKIKTDGTEKMQLTKDMVILPFSVENNYIYFSLSSFAVKDSDVGLYRVDIDGLNRIKLSGDDCGNIIIEGDWIYYKNNSDHSTLYRIKKDGTQRNKFLDLSLSCFNISDNTIYYASVEDPSNLYKLNLSDNKQYQLTNNSSTVFNDGFSILAINIIDENIFCFCNDLNTSFFYRVKNDGSLDKIIY